ncbi:MAG: DUF4830 domain-containing protein [Clostridia bacterium]|nr:DUF4830 domain-containing protein [Clostridia bacterium]
MKFFITLSKKSLAVILAVLVIALVITGQAFSAKAGRIDGSTNALRVSYLKGLGLDPNDSDCVSKEITIPQSFSEVYQSYNRLQKKAGFDLSRYKGRSATVYTYPLTAGTVANLVVCDGEVIGGDIAETALNGQMKPLLKN